MRKKMIGNSTIQVCVESGVRDEAEAILARLGIPVPEAVGLFLRQVVLRRGMPFEMRPPCLDELDAKALRAEMQKGLDDMEAGRFADLSDFRLELAREGRV